MLGISSYARPIDHKNPTCFNRWSCHPNLHIASKAFPSTEILKDYRFPYDLNQLVKNSLDVLVKDFNSYSGLNFTLEVNTTWFFTEYIIKITE